MTAQSQSAELVEAWAALPDSVSGDAAPEGTSLAERIMALTAERDYRHRGWGRTVERARVLRGQLDAVRMVCADALKLPHGGMVRASDLLDALKAAETGRHVDTSPDTVPAALVDAWWEGVHQVAGETEISGAAVKAGIAAVLRAVAHDG